MKFQLVEEKERDALQLDHSHDKNHEIPMVDAAVMRSFPSNPSTNWTIPGLS